MGEKHPLLPQIAELVSAVSTLMWPVVVLLVFWILRSKILDLIAAGVERVSKASEIVIGSLQIKGAVVESTGEILNKYGQVIKAGDTSVELLPATPDEVSRRHEIHNEQHGFMLVHTISPVEPPSFHGKLRVFNVSVYLHSHRGNGDFGTVESVSYFFGAKWGRGPNGSKFVVRSAAEEFALTARMYGACLCLAEVKLKSGHKFELRRYMDVEMAPVYGVELRDARVSK